MSLTFYLLRHAEAEPHSLKKEDIERALTERGMRDAERLGAHIAAHKFQGFDYVWCSSAVRTRQTLENLQRGFAEQGAAFSAPVQCEKKLYHASAARMLDILRLTPPEAKRVLMIGHNPGISELAAMLAGQGDEELVRGVGIRYPTCSLSIYTFSCTSWQEAGPETSAIKAFLTSENMWQCA